MTESQQNDGRLYPERPIVAVSAIIFDQDRILMIKRAKDPGKGMWSIPGGRLELGETLYEAGNREVREECSIEIEIERLLDVRDMILKDDDGRIFYDFVIVYLIARHKSGEIKADFESMDIGWFKRDEITGLDMHPMLRDVLVKAGLT